MELEYGMNVDEMEIGWFMDKWRNWNSEGIDQIKSVIETLKKNLIVGE